MTEYELRRGVPTMPYPKGFLYFHNDKYLVGGRVHRAEMDKELIDVTVLDWDAVRWFVRPMPREDVMKWIASGGTVVNERSLLKIADQMLREVEAK